jgi:hypothetical protein
VNITDDGSFHWLRLGAKSARDKGQAFTTHPPPQGGGR